MKNYLNNPIIQGYISSNRFGELLGMDFEILSPGEVLYHLPITEKLLATPRAAHGGAISALIDATMGVGALSCVIADGKVVSTIELKVSYLCPALLGDRLTGTAQVIKAGKTLIFVEGKIQNQRGETVAFGTATFNPYPATKAGF